MNEFLRHLRGKFQIIVLDPLYWILFIPLILTMFIGYWVELPMDLQLRSWFGSLRWVIVAVMASILMGGRTTRGTRVSLNKIGVPALPIGPFTRLAADVVFLIFILLTARIIHLIFAGNSPVIQTFNETLIGVTAIIPILMVFTPRERGRRVFHFLDSIVVVVGSGIFIELGVLASPVTALPASMLLITVAELADRFENSLFRSFQPNGRYSGAMTRPSGDPSSMFRRDLWLGSLKRNILPVFLFLFMEMMGIAIYLAFEVPQIVLIIWTGIVYYFLFCLLVLPAGTGSIVTETGEKSNFYSDFDGSFLDAWSVLPLHPNQIIRGTYVYVSTVALIFWVATLLTFIVLRWPYSISFWIPFLIAIPCLAGLFTMSAAGNKPQSIFLAILFCAELIIGMGLVDPPHGPGFWGILILVLFLIAGIVPVVPVLARKQRF